MQISQAQEKFRIVGYVMQRNIPLLSDHELSMITHLEIAFINPDENGNLIFGPYLGGGNFTEGEIPISTAVGKAKKYGVKTAVSLAGGGFWGDLTMINRYRKLMNDENRPQFIANLVEYIDDNNLDGIDIDIEGDCINEYLGVFMKELSDTCHKRDWEVTAAWSGAGQWADMLSDTALAYVDYLYIMSYDATGAWAPNKLGPHAPYDKAIKDIQYYKKRNVNSERIVLGLPFYGRSFEAGVTSPLYREIVGMQNDAYQKDQIGKLWYDGQPMIKKKTELAINESCSGIMIWEITMDIRGKKSLLNEAYINSLNQNCIPHQIKISIEDNEIILSNLPKEKIQLITILDENDTFLKSFIYKRIKQEDEYTKIKLKKYLNKKLIIKTNRAYYQIILGE